MAPAAIMLGAAAITAYGEGQKGSAAKAAGKFSARQGVRNAKSSMAEGIRKANEIRRQGDVAKSDAAAAMAASGGVTDDVGAIKTLADIEQVTDYNALSAIYEGGQKSDQQRLQAKMDKLSGKQAQTASYFKAAGTMLKGASSAYSMGGNGGAPSSNVVLPSSGGQKFGYGGAYDGSF